MKNICTRLKNLRQDHDLSQKQVADYLGIPQQTYSNYERDIREIPSSHVAKLAMLYHVSTDFLLGMDAASAKQYNLDAAFLQDISFKKVLLHLLQLDPHNKKEFIRFLSYLMRT